MKDNTGGLEYVTRHIKYYAQETERQDREVLIGKM